MRLNVQMQSGIYVRLMAAAAREGRSVSDVIRQLVNDWLREVEPIQAKQEKDDGRG